MEEWKEYKLGDVLSEKGYIRGPFGSALKRGDLISEGIPVYEQQHAIYNKRDFRFYISEDKYNEMKRFTVYPDDIIISCSGTVGEVSLIKKEDPQGIISQALLLLRANNNIILPSYLLYFFKTTIGHNAITSRSTGSVQVNIARREIIEDIPLYLPCIDGQRKIVSILKSLDDKIECNRRINDNLEQQAQALFKSWFVDFEPFRDGEFVESELGMIPKGWRVDRIENFCDVFTGRKNVNESTAEGNYPFFSCSPTNTYSNDFVYDGEVVLIAGNGSYTGRTSYYIGKFDLYQRTYACVMKKDVSKEMSAFVYFMMKCFFEPQKMGGTRGSSIPYIVMNDITLQCFPFNNEIVMRFSRIAYDILLKTFENEQESRRLASLRDSLLPKLMSGEIKVGDVTL